MELVVGASQATMKSLLGKLGDLLAREYALVRGVRSDIQYINDELASMQAFLVNLSAAGAEDHDAQTKDWMKQIRDVAYDIEDGLDDFIRRLPSDPQAGGCLAEIRLRVHELWTCRPRRDIAAEIADLKYRAQQVGERRIRYDVKNPKRRGSSTDARPIGFDAAEDQLATAQLVCTKEPVGMGDDLGKWIVDEDKGGVLSISGFGGLGKTTIAKALYRKYGDQFDRRAMVTVSQGSDVAAILRSILSQVKPQDNNPEQQVSGGASYKGRFDCLNIKLCPLKLWSKQKDSSEGRSEDKHGVARTQKEGDMQRAPSAPVRSSHVAGGNTDQGNPEQENIMAFFRCTLWQVMPCAGHGKNHDETNELDNLVKELKAELELDEKRFILLIDDVWSATTWESIKKRLPQCKKGSKIIVTTRFQAVVKACYKDQKTDKFHSVKPLDNKDAAKLFEEAVSESRSTKAGQRKDAAKLFEEAVSESRSTKAGQRKGNEENEEPPNRIWEMCGGLPLAIVTMAGNVACNPQKPRKKWNDVCKSLFPETSGTDFRKDKSDSLNPEGITKILNYCYNDLPADLKTCSLYLSIFPKGSKISRKRLTRRWVAEGFVSEKQGLSEEDVAEAYFNHLMRRKILRPVEHSSSGKVKTCQVHDMVLEYIVSKSSEENFTTVTGGHWLVPMHSSKVRRLSLQSIDSNHAKAVERMNLSHLRSLSVFGSLDQLPSHSFKIGLVQVLDLEGCKGFKQKHIKDISKMPLLKYLSLRGTDIDKIPKDIDKLQYLETLDIRETKVNQLPESIGQLDRMSNILGGDKMTRKALKLPEEIKKETMRTLRVLSGIEIVEGSRILENPHDFTGLKKLVIYKLGIAKDKAKAFDDLLSAIQYLGGYSLQSLTIDHEHSDFLDLLSSIPTPPKYLHALELSGRLLKLPDWIGFLDDLNKLTLSVTVLRTSTLELLQKLPRLFSLTFSLSTEKHHKDLVASLEKNKSDSDGVIVIQGYGFESLKLLRFSAPILPLLRFSEKAMPELERLELQFRMLEGIFGMDNLKNLQEVHLRVHEKAGKTTGLIVADLINAARNFANKPRVIRDEYYDRLKDNTIL